jgi:hypothetical protein
MQLVNKLTSKEKDSRRFLNTIITNKLYGVDSKLRSYSHSARQVEHYNSVDKYNLFFALSVPV